MSRTVSFPDEVIDVAREQVGKAATARDMRAGLSVLLPALLGVPKPLVAEVLGVGTATVSRMQQELRDQVRGRAPEKAGWGGRRRETVSYEQEAAFLEPWALQAATGGVLLVPPIHAAFEQKVGHPVAPSTVYRMLARHGWRKVEPDTCHPNRDAEAQEQFKKGASRRRWRKLWQPTATRCP